MLFYIYPNLVNAESISDQEGCRYPITGITIEELVQLLGDIEKAYSKEHRIRGFGISEGNGENVSIGLALPIHQEIEEVPADRHVRGCKGGLFVGSYIAYFERKESHWILIKEVKDNCESFGRSIRATMDFVKSIEGSFSSEMNITAGVTYMRDEIDIYTGLYESDTQNEEIICYERIQKEWVEKNDCKNKTPYSCGLRK